MGKKKEDKEEWSLSKFGSLFSFFFLFCSVSFKSPINGGDIRDNRGKKRLALASFFYQISCNNSKVHFYQSTKIQDGHPRERLLGEARLSLRLRVAIRREG